MADTESRALEIKRQIKALRRGENTVRTRKQIKQLYATLDEVQFKPDYLCLIIDREKDYRRACKGFVVNGLRYHRLLGTNGGVKNSTIVFIADRHGDEIRRRIENGRDQTKELVPAKLEAYRALACSASIPVSYPNGVLVVPDNETKFLADIIYITDENGGEPIMEARKNEEVMLNASDGCGMMCPALAERWSRELGLSYVMSGANTRAAYEKGMVFTFDFHEFARDVAGQCMVKDAWGNMVDIRQVELVLTTSMLKLWDSYESCEAYLRNCIENHYTFSIPKVCPEALEDVHSLNYQFIQSYNLSEEDLNALIQPTMDELSGVLQNDPMQTVLFLRGTNLTEESVWRLPDDFVKALMIEPELIHDPYVQSSVYNALRGHITDAKIGVLDVHGNYSIACGDLYALCQSMFGMEVTGLLEAGNVYSAYWAESGSLDLVCFRAPMSTHSNIRAVHVDNSDKTKHWFRHIRTGTIFNCWDTCCAALNGMDFDGDLVMLTDNDVLVRNHRQLPALMCAQRKAAKKVATEEDLVEANIASFGDEIGKTTNWVTSMYEVRSRYEEGDEEYDMLSYRINAGQLYQQNTIDKTKGIICQPMPSSWHNHHAIADIPDESIRDFYSKIVADKKPYFMKYIYPALSRQYKTFVTNTDKNAYREFGVSVKDLYAMQQRTHSQEEFLSRYERMMPVGLSPCTMNRICWKFENAFDGHIGRHNAEHSFDYTILKSGIDYPSSIKYAISRLYADFNDKLRTYKIYAKYEQVDDDEAAAQYDLMRDDFRRQCHEICPNSKMLCDIVLDICYKKNATKAFAWEMCGGQIIENLLRRTGGNLRFPKFDATGELSYAGMHFALTEVKDIHWEDDDDSTE